MERLLNSFINEHNKTFLEYFEKYRSDNLSNRSDYKEFNDRLVVIYKKYPNVQKYIEMIDNVNLDENEKACREVKEILDNIKKIEIKEGFKLGFKEAYIYFEEMEMLNI